MRAYGLLAAAIAATTLAVGAACGASVPQEAPAPSASATPEARAATERPQRVVAIGDSIMGTAATAPNGWLRQYAEAIGADDLTNLAVNGWFSHEILDALRSDARFRESVSRAGVIALNAGMNDFFTGRDLYSKGACGGPDNEQCLRHMVGRFNSNWDEIMLEVRGLAPETPVIVANLYHPLEALDQYYGWADAMNRHLIQMNRHIAGTYGVTIADLHRTFNGESGLEDPIAKGYILPDAIHATALGHDVIAGALLRLEAAVAPPPSGGVSSFAPTVPSW